MQIKYLPLFEILLILWKDTPMQSWTKAKNYGFTFIEIAVVILIIGIVIIAPYFINWAPFSLYLDTNTSFLVSTLRYTQNMSMSRNNRYRLQLNTAGSSYAIIDPDNQAVTIPGTSGNATLDEGIFFGDISGISSSIIFDGQGIPYPDTSPTIPLTSSATIALQNTSGDQMTVVIAPATGVVTYYWEQIVLEQAQYFAPLFEAIYKNNAKTVELLLADPKTNPNLLNEAGDTALLQAIDNNDIKIIELLLADLRTDPNLSNKYGILPIFKAIDKKNVKIVSAK